MSNEPRLNYFAAATNSTQALVTFSNAVGPVWRLPDRARQTAHITDQWMRLLPRHAYGGAAASGRRSARIVNTVAGWRERRSSSDPREAGCARLGRGGQRDPAAPARRCRIFRSARPVQ